MAEDGQWASGSERLKTVILCGGLGMRLREETVNRPKPLVEVGEHPILWHIMKIYAHYGLNEFVLAIGYRGDDIKQYFLNFYNLSRDLTVSLKEGDVESQGTVGFDWTVEMRETGLSTMTGGRLKRLNPDLAPHGTFLLTYGDGVADIDIRKLIAFHRSHGKLATVTAVHPPARFGALEMDGDVVRQFSEKPQTNEGWINGGFFVFEPAVLDYIEDDSIELERAPLENLAKDGQLMAYRHEGFWHSMDTVRDRQVLEGLWEGVECPWKVWND